MEKINFKNPKEIKTSLSFFSLLKDQTPKSRFCNLDIQQFPWFSKLIRRPHCPVEAKGTL